jgi:hypothetical protein
MTTTLREFVWVATIVLSALVFATACGDSGGGGGGGEHQGQGSWSFDITGEVDGSQSGFAFFVQPRNIISYNLSQDDDYMTVSFTNGAEEVLSPGTYSIGSGGAADPGVDVVFQLWVDENGDGEATTYTTRHTDGGTMEVTESSANSVSGTFEIEMSRVDGNLEEIPGSGITITNGEFTAYLFEQ